MVIERLHAFCCLYSQQQGGDGDETHALGAMLPALPILKLLIGRRTAQDSIFCTANIFSTVFLPLESNPQQGEIYGIFGTF